MVCRQLSTHFPQTLNQIKDNIVWSNSGKCISNKKVRKIVKIDLTLS